MCFTTRGGQKQNKEESKEKIKRARKAITHGNIAKALHSL
jgi:hypothetical protein